MARKIKSNKSLLGIAREYGVSVADLRRLNPASAQKSGKIREVRIPSARLKGDKKEQATNAAREKRVKSGKATGSDFMKWIRGETDAGGRAKARTKKQGVKRTPVKTTRSQEVYPATGLGTAKAIASKATPTFKTCSSCPSKGACRAKKKCLKRKPSVDPKGLMKPRRGGK